MDRELTSQIEALLERRRRLRETADSVANRPPLLGGLKGGRDSGPPTALHLPPADYIDGPNGGKKRKKKKKKKKTAEAIIPERLPAGPPLPSARPTRGVKVVEETILRGRDIIPASRYLPQETWVEVVKKCPRKAATTATITATATAAVRPPSLPIQRETSSRAKPQKPPNSSAVTLTCPPGKYEATMRTAKASIKPEDLEITRMRFKRAVTGALTMEIPGDREGKKANALAERLTTLFAGNEEIKVVRPTKTAELRIKDLDDSVTAGEVSKAVAESGGCLVEEVRTGAVSRAPNGLARSGHLGEMSADGR